VVTNSWYTGVLAGCRAKPEDRTSVNLCHNLRKNASPLQGYTTAGRAHKRSTGFDRTRLDSFPTACLPSLPASGHIHALSQSLDTFEPHPSLDGTKCRCLKGSTSTVPFRHRSRLWAFSLNGVDRNILSGNEQVIPGSEEVIPGKT